MTSSYNFLEDLLGRTSYKIAMTILRHLSNPYRNSQHRFVEVGYAQIIQFLFVPGFVVHLRCKQLILICHRGSWPRLVDIVEDGMTMIINSSLN